MGTGATGPTGTSSFSLLAAAPHGASPFLDQRAWREHTAGLFTTNMSLTAKHVATIATTAKTRLILAPQLYSLVNFGNWTPTTQDFRTVGKCICRKEAKTVLDRELVLLAVMLVNFSTVADDMPH